MRRVVITRVGVIAPNGHSWDAFSRALEQGKSGLSTIDHFNPQAFTARIGGQIKGFDQEALIRQFPKLTRVADTKVFYGVHAFLEMIKSGPLPDMSRCAVNLGTSLERFLIEKIFRLSPHRFDMARYLNALTKHPDEPYLQVPLDFLGSFLKQTFGIGGPQYLHCSACTAGTQALGNSFHMIRDGRFDRIVTGGFDSMLNPLGLGGFTVLGAVSDENDLGPKAIRPFDLTRKGTILGEGAAFFLLEDLETARANGSEILGEITGYGSSLDAYKVSEPSLSGITAAMKDALSDARLAPGDIDYISAHGTGTPLNDTVETQAVKHVFKEKAKHIPMSSVKSMTGHLIGASGAVETAGILAMIKGEFIAPTINLDTPDPECDLDYVPLIARRQRISVVLKNSMGFGGQNACLVIKRFTP